MSPLTYTALVLLGSTMICFQGCSGDARLGEDCHTEDEDSEPLTCSGNGNNCVKNDGTVCMKSDTDGCKCSAGEPLGKDCHSSDPATESLACSGNGNKCVKDGTACMKSDTSGCTCRTDCPTLPKDQCVVNKRCNWKPKNTRRGLIATCGSPETMLCSNFQSEEVCKRNTGCSWIEQNTRRQLGGGNRSKKCASSPRNCRDKEKKHLCENAKCKWNGQDCAECFNDDDCAKNEFCDKLYCVPKPAKKDGTPTASVPPDNTADAVPSYKSVLNFLRQENMHTPTYTNLGTGTCAVEDSAKEGGKKTTSEYGLIAGSCQDKCNNEQECNGFSDSSKRNCVLYLVQRIHIKLQPVPNSSLRCMVKDYAPAFLLSDEVASLENLITTKASDQLLSIWEYSENEEPPEQPNSHKNIWMYTTSAESNGSNEIRQLRFSEYERYQNAHLSGRNKQWVTYTYQDSTRQHHNLNIFYVSIPPTTEEEMNSLPVANRHGSIHSETLRHLHYLHLKHSDELPFNNAKPLIGVHVGGGSTPCNKCFSTRIPLFYQTLYVDFNAFQISYDYTNIYEDINHLPNMFTAKVVLFIVHIRNILLSDNNKIIGFFAQIRLRFSANGVEDIQKCITDKQKHPVIFDQLVEDSFKADDTKGIQIGTESIEKLRKFFSDNSVKFNELLKAPVIRDEDNVFIESDATQKHLVNLYCWSLMITQSFSQIILHTDDTLKKIVQYSMDVTVKRALEIGQSYGNLVKK
eukprot:GEMP01019425.1.p1 GENE.GEMP01019425.1~~GEMP01019425.1.p1  ORF type:complete len:760 (+),score=36.35 GEMP01019425.1:52-2280(+)